MPPTPQNDEDGPGSGLTTTTDREEKTETITNGHSQDSKQYEGSPDIDGNESIDAEYNRLMNYPSDDDEADYYGLLGLSRDPPPKDAEIRSAYRILTLSFHPDKQPAHLREPAEKQFTRIRDAYETLIDPQKRTVYNLLGAEGVRQEWSHGGLMGRRGDAERQELGVKTMSPEEFRRWFLGTMKARERKVVDSLVQSRGSLTIGVDASDMISIDEDENVYLYIPTLDLSDYAVSCSFKAPVPPLPSLAGREDEKTEENQAESGSAREDQSDGVEMLINAGISGQLQQQVQDIIIPKEDGSQEIQEIPLSTGLIARSLTLGANVNYVLRDMASKKGLMSRRPFSYLNDTGVSASALLLPQPTLAMNFAKAITPFPRTTPFNVNLSTTFTGSILKQLPQIGLKMSKALSARKIAFCSWSSGTLPLPFVEQEPIFLKQLSSFEIGFLSLPERSRNAEPEDEDDEEDEETQDTQRKKREANEAREVFQCQVEASPISGSLSVNYSRNIFSGKPADELVRSEWSSEGHYRPPQDSGSRSVRLEIVTTVGLNLALAWSVSGTRQVGEFTRMGLGVGIEGGRGLVMTVSWRRLGQRIKIPIALCPLDAVSADLAALAVTLPWAAYCAVEFGLLRPRERRRRRQAIAQRRKELKKLIPKKQAESQQTIELMAEQVRRRQSKEDAHGGLVVTKAEYGYIPNKKTRHLSSESKIIDVTIPVAALVDRGQLVIPRETVKFHIIGFYDPAPLLPKRLSVWYRFGGREHFVEADDSEGIACPMRTHLLPS